MTEAAQNYFKTYYKLQRLIDEKIYDKKLETELRQKLNEAFTAMTERERELLDIVGKNNIKE
jgi:hypothetical protein